MLPLSFDRPDRNALYKIPLQKRIQQYLSLIHIFRECYCKVKELLVCGYPITLQRLKEHGLDYEYSSAVTNAVNKLRDRNFDAFADMWSSFLHYQEQEIRNYIENSPSVGNLI